MERLTTDNKKSIMFHLNTFFAKDGEVWVRSGGPYPDFQDVTLVQWIRMASSKHGLNFTAEDPEHLGDEMYDALQDGDETVEGIVALMHEAAVQAAEMRGRLKRIEDILGDDYDLDRLSVLVNQRMTMREDVAARMQLVGSIPLYRLSELAEAERDGRISIWAPDEQRNMRKAVKVAVRDLIQIGESLVDVPVERIKELVEADREGRCAVLPISTPSIAYTVDRKGGYISSGFYRTPGSVLHDIERGYIIVKDHESAEAVLKGEKDGKEV